MFKLLGICLKNIIRKGFRENAESIRQNRTEDEAGTEIVLLRTGKFKKSFTFRCLQVDHLPKIPF